MKFYLTLVGLTLISFFEIIASDPLVKTTLNGRVRGITLQSSTNKYVNAWYGIPFAKPPIGNLRFQRPVSPNSWTGILETTTKPKACLQDALDIQSEDCLYLNVVTPKNCVGKLKVMIWIYGGGFFAGSSSFDIYDLRNLVAEENVIAVSFQYRISSLGFLYLGIPEAPGNVGLFDELLALEWVKENILNFGGDPEMVTLFGESAGAASVGFHLLSPLSKNVFKRAILESGAPTVPWALSSKTTSIKNALSYAKNLNCSYDSTNLKEVVQCLKQIDGNLLILKKDWNVPLGLGGDSLFFPIVDGIFLTDTPENLLSSVNFRDKNILLGNNNDEAGLFFILTMTTYFPDMNNVFVTKQIMKEAVNSLLGNKFNQYAINAIIFEYTKSIISGPNTNYRDAFLRLGSDYYFNCHTNKLAQKFSEEGNDVYRYIFTHRSGNSPYPPWVKSTHGDEMPYVFGTTLDTIRGFTDDERQLTTIIMRYWTNFAKTGDPNDNEIEQFLWPKYNTIRQDCLKIYLKSFEIENCSITSNECKVWDAYQ